MNGQENEGTGTLRYRLVRSGRRTLGLEIREGELIVRAPYRATRQEIDRMLREKRSWIDSHLAKSRQKIREAAAIRPMNREELYALGQKAVEYIPGRVRYYAGLLGVQPRKITIRNQRTRWGSCSSQGNLNFNVLLMLTPPEAIDSVVVHELCHLKEMNHSERFYREVLSVFPDYYRWHDWLKEHQTELMARLG